MKAVGSHPPFHPRFGPAPLVPQYYVSDELRRKLLPVIASLRRVRWATWRPKLVEIWPSYDRQPFISDELVDAAADLSRFAPIVILRLRDMPAIDATGLRGLEVLSDRLQRTGRAMILWGAREQPAAFLHQAAFVEHVGADNIVPHVEAALARAREVWARGPVQLPDAVAGTLR